MVQERQEAALGGCEARSTRQIGVEAAQQSLGRVTHLAAVPAWPADAPGRTGQGMVWLEDPVSHRHTAALSATAEWEAEPGNGSGQQENGRKSMTAPS